MKKIKFLPILFAFFSLQLFAQTKILFLGDSLTAGYGIDRAKAFPSLVGKKLNAKKPGSVEIINGGISGSTTAGGLKRLNWYKLKKPQILILALGANDGLRGVNLKSSEENLSKVIERAKELKMKIILAGMLLPMNYGKDYRQQFEKMFKSLAKKYQLPLIPFLLKGVGGEPKYNIEDGIHPNEEGHNIISKTLTPYIEKLL